MSPTALTLDLSTFLLNRSYCMLLVPSPSTSCASVCVSSEASITHGSLGRASTPFVRCVLLDRWLDWPLDR